MRHFLEALFYSAIGSICMVAKDITGTVYTDAVSNGKAKLAGKMDALKDYAEIVLASYSGVQLIHLGWVGWLGIIPIGITGYFATLHSVKWSHNNIKPEDEVHPE